ncbi:hypothetical protein H6G69_15545 [Nostoc sp. FACHB-110]|nr:hypothetical protein [Nostoc sp. FACHB-110]
MKQVSSPSMTVGLVFLLSTQHGLNAPLPLTALSTFKSKGRRKEGFR